MKIAINLFTLIPGKIGGLETYANKTLEYLLPLHPHQEYILFTNSENHALYQQYAKNRDNIGVIRLCGSARSRLKRLLCVFFWLPVRCAREKVDAVFSPGNIAPLWLWRGCRSLVTIHDAVDNSNQNGWNTRLQRLLYRLSARHAWRVITVSQHAAKEITRYCHIDPRKIVVTRQGYGIDPDKPVSTRDIQAIKQQTGFSRFILSVGFLITRKNFVRLIEAFAGIQDNTIGLLIVGQQGEAESDIRACIRRLGLQQRVRLTGYFDGALETLYHACEFYVQPSLYEGFGLPVIEAMALGKPVLCSDAGALRETGGEAALYFNPLDTRELTTKMDCLLSDPALRQQLSIKGKAQAQKFSWQANAQLHWQLLTEQQDMTTQ